jgi:hypothetical protein
MRGRRRRTASALPKWCNPVWRLRVWIVAAGFAVAPVVAVLVFGILMGARRGLDDEASWSWYGFVLALLVTSLATLVVAIPLYLVARHAQAVSLGTILGGGIVTSLLTTMLVMRGADGSDLLASLAVGAMAALAFWLIWRCGRGPSEPGKTLVQPTVAGEDQR